MVLDAPHSRVTQVTMTARTAFYHLRLVKQLVSFLDFHGRYNDSFIQARLLQLCLCGAALDLDPEALAGVECGCMCANCITLVAMHPACALLIALATYITLDPFQGIGAYF